MPETNQHSPVMTLTQAAAYLRVSKAHLSNVINGKVPGVPPVRQFQDGPPHPDQARVGGRVDGSRPPEAVR